MVERRAYPAGGALLARKTLPLRSLFCGLVLVSGGVVFGAVGPARAADSSSDSGSGSTVPNIYLDLRTYYTSVPPGSIGFGLGGRGGSVPNIGSILAHPGAGQRSLSTDLPLTLDLNENISVWGGATLSSTQADNASWSAFAVQSVNFGGQIAVTQQNGPGTFPTVTIQATVTSTLPGAVVGTTQFQGIAEGDYAFDSDETRGLLFGVRANTLSIAESALGFINPAIAYYVGGYYQWDNNWKVTGRAGIQHFGGGEFFGRAVYAPFTKPVLRLDLDRMDDNDNRLFGVTFEVDWTPKPTYQLTVRTPLYAVRN